MLTLLDTIGGLGQPGQTTAGANEFRFFVKHMATGTPVAGAMVYLFSTTQLGPAGQSKQVRSALTGSDGRVTLYHDPAGASPLYTYAVTKTGFQKKVGTAFPVGENVVSLAPAGVTTDSVIFKLSPAMAGVNVTLWDKQAGMSIGLKKTDSSGLVIFPGLNPLRDYTVSFHARGYSPVSFYEIPVHNKEHIYYLERALTTVLLEIRVTKSDTGAPLRNAQVALIRVDSAGGKAVVIDQKMTNDKGYAGFWTAPGNYNFSVSQTTDYEGTVVRALPKQVLQVTVKKKPFPSKVTPIKTGVRVGLPSWALPVGIGVLVLIGGIVFLRK